MKKNYTRVTAFSIIILCIFLILIVRLVDIQIVNGDTYKNTAEAKGEKQIIELAPRGEILDKFNRKLATDQQSFNITYSNVNSKIDNTVINKELIEAIKLINNNGDADKLNIQNFPITVVNNKYTFNYTAKNEKLKIMMANDFVNKILQYYNLSLPKVVFINNSKSTSAQNLAANEKNLSARARDIFCFCADKFGLTKAALNPPAVKSKTINKSKDNIIIIDYNIRTDINIDLMQKLIALRLAIKDTGYSQYKLVYIANNVKRATALAMDTKANDLEGIASEVSPMRVYPNKEVGSAFLGYIGKIYESEAQKYSSLGYDINRELVGKMGLEKVLENDTEDNIQLRGEPGYKYFNVDKFGRILKQTATLDSIPGDTVVTTIDLDLQKVAENALDNTMHDIVTGKIKSDANYTNANRGAAVVVDVRTGEILALASRPGFDPNWFSATGSISDAISKIVFPTGEDKYDLLPKPMFNYATQGSGPPGSTFKPLVSIAALQEKAITPSTIIIDRGIYTLVKGFRGACWKWNEYHSTHGPVNLAKALEVSCNYFFFDVGRRLGYTNFEKWSALFGLAADPVTGEAPSTGIEIGENPGSVSSPDKYKATNVNFVMRDQVINYLNNIKYGGYIITKGTDEYKVIKAMFMSGVYDENKLLAIGIGNTKALAHLKNQIHIFDKEANSVGQLLNASIGQGSTLLTPLQMVNYISTLVNGGYRYKLHLVKKVLTSNGVVKKVIQPEVLNKIELDPANVNAVKDGMRKVTEEGGTAVTAFKGFPYPTGGKTGSASVSPGQTKHGRSAYGWYVGFAPLDNPQIAVAVVIYDAGHGGSVAQVARAIYDEYFKLNKPKTTSAGVNVNTNVD